MRILAIDAGVACLRARLHAEAGAAPYSDVVVPISGDMDAVLAAALPEGWEENGDVEIRLTGRLAPAARRILGRGAVVRSAALLWNAAAAAAEGAPAVAIEISASGYALAGVEADGSLRDDLLAVNPRCGAGTGSNLDRVLQKLAIRREDVDDALVGYSGPAGTPGSARRAAATVRADRCGVFGSSATISDKNQGIPLDVALATTMKSEVLKACARAEEGFRKAILLGRVLKWRFAREIAEDALKAAGVETISFDPDGDAIMDALIRFPLAPGAETAPLEAGLEPDERPPFAAILSELSADGRYLRLSPKDGAISEIPDGDVSGPLHLGLDVGSTMAKAILARDDGSIAAVLSCSNAGDTIETVKRLLSEIKERLIALGDEGELKLRSVGITGSARFQVKEALARTYPALADRISALVENYAHAHGSIAIARRRVAELKADGRIVNDAFCVLVDIGGEDTKLSVIALDEAELFSNAMNLKCSAGTGSLMDSLAVALGLSGPAEASAEAMSASRGLHIDATCAVFLMENARRLRAEGVARNEIAASAAWAVVENMARSLWPQVELPKNPVVLLHGQTMLSDPLPLATASRLTERLGGAWAVIPPHPGHRACIGLVERGRAEAPAGYVSIDPETLIGSAYGRKVIQCRGAACGDPAAVCNRTALKCDSADGGSFSFTLGGCGAINEMMARKASGRNGRANRADPPPDIYKELWDMVASRLPRTNEADRIVVPRSFCVSEQAFLLAGILSGLGLRPHVDDVRVSDAMDGAAAFNVDTCAPQIGAVGQMRRLASEPHAFILAPQIEFLPTTDGAVGRACTINQGGPLVAKGLAENHEPNARIHAFALDLSNPNPAALAADLRLRLSPLFDGTAGPDEVPSLETFRRACAEAIAADEALRDEIGKKAATMARAALDAGHRVAVVVGREYILNPGIYDSHVRRLLRDKGMAAIPSWALRVSPDPDYAHLYWRNPHVMTTIIAAAAAKRLHERLLEPELAKLFAELESDDAELLPVIQVSTFTCGPDSVTAPLVAEIMKRRPFLVIQSDAVIQELAHLENRVNTYVKQLELDLHSRLAIGGERSFEIRSLDALENGGRLNRERDVLYVPTLGDNRPVSAVLRAAGFACPDNWNRGHSLERIVRQGRATAGDAVCAPLAGVYGDVERAVADFAERRKNGDPATAGKDRLLFLNNKGNGPCRQGQYVETHKLFAGKALGIDSGPAGGALPCGGAMQFLVMTESSGYDLGIPDWARARLYQAAVLQGVLQSLGFKGAERCRDAETMAIFQDDIERLKLELHAALEAWTGPGPLGRALVSATAKAGALGDVAKLFAWRVSPKDLAAIIARFVEKWKLDKPEGNEAPRRLRVLASGEAYMRVAMAEDVHRALVAAVGHGRLSYDVSPLWCYAEYLLEEQIGYAEERRSRAISGERRDREAAKKENETIAGLRKLGTTLRDVVAAPLYAAARIAMPAPVERLLKEALPVVPTLRPVGELAPYVGETLHALAAGIDVVLNVAPTGCMVATMGEALTPRILRIAADKGNGEKTGRIQHIFSVEGDIDAEQISIAVLKAVGPDGLAHGKTI